MRTSIKNYFFRSLFLLTCMITNKATASHIVGGGFTYTCVGDSVHSGNTFRKYELKMELYQDCQVGAPEAIAQDNPASFTVFDNDNPGTYFVFFDNIYSHDFESIPAGYIGGPCGAFAPIGLPSMCLRKVTFTKNCVLPSNVNGYTIAYQRCCRNSSPINLLAPADAGTTYFCEIPSLSLADHNTSAVFTNYPSQVICLNTPILFDHSATDADGDSLSYELSPAYSGASKTNIKPLLSMPPPFEPVPYFQPYAFDNPMASYPQLNIDAKTGIFSGTPNRIGRYIICVLVKEWRNGTLINTTRREFEWSVIDCTNLSKDYRPYAGADNTIVLGQKVNFSGSGSVTYSWSPSTYLDDPNAAGPEATITAAGDYTYVLHGVSDSGCNGTDTVIIHVLDHSDFATPNAFTPNNDGLNDIFWPLPIGMSTQTTIRVFNRWGNVVFTNTQGAGWDGTSAGKPQQPGLYAWMIEYTDNNGQRQLKRGNVLLIR
jgi:gliding motility-associated-like protein